MVISIIKKIYSKNVPRFIRRKVQIIRLKIEIKKVQKQHIELVKELKLKKKINVIFLVIHDSTWKYEEIYRLLNENPRFNVMVVVIPLVRSGIAQMENYNQTLDYFQKNGYNTMPSYDKQNKEWLDIKNLTKPDIVFFTNPHKLTFDKYYINEFKEKLTCYVPYSFQVSNLYQLQFNQPFHNILWKQFYETEIHRKIGEKYSVTKGKNIIVTGYPQIDILIGKKFDSDPWKIKDKNVKRIIWAPHHTIQNYGANLDYSTFLNYSEFFLELLHLFKNDIQIAFKPHPLLKEKLYLHSNWGKKKTDEFYNKWETFDNAFFYDGEYSNLFHYSDAMIHDSGSFTAEYLLLNKPVMFLLTDDKVYNNFNKFGKMCLQKHYIGKSKISIIKFIQDIVIGGNDNKENDRRVFVENYCIPPNNISASKNIVNYIERELG